MNIDKLNCLIDLHVHLDGSLSVDTIKKLADMQHRKLDMSDEQLLTKLKVPDDCQDLNEYLSKFDYPLSFLQSQETITEAVRCLLTEQKAQGIIYTEIRFAPQLHLKQGLKQNEVIEAAIKGMQKVTGITSGLILCCMRGQGEQQKNQNLETVKLAATYLKQGVVALDLAGAEGLFPTDDFAELFQLAKQLEIPFTIHAGEAAGPESIRQAVQFGAQRIGHGVRCLEDRQVCQLIIDRNITLEICPTSNLNTRVYESIQDYPIKQLLDAGIKVTINTDNMMVSNTTIKQELKLLQRTFALDDQAILQFLYNAVNAAFTTDKVKEDLNQNIEHIVQGIK